MTCGSCGNQNPPGARYCTRCGTELAEPTPIAAVAAAANGAMARAARAQAANAAQADPAALMVQAANQSSAEPAWREPPGLREDRNVPISPAYNTAPARRGIAALLLALCAIAAVAVVTVWRLGSSPAPADTVTAARAPSIAVPAAPVPPPAEVTAPLEAAIPSETTAQREAESSQAGAGVESAEPVEITPLPARPAPARGARRPAAEKASAPPPPAPGASPAPTAPVTRAPVARAPATVPSVAPVNDRWARMKDELSRCTREDFITRVICGQRVRFRYCEGYWGKVDACPASPAPERGQ